MIVTKRYSELLAAHKRVQGALRAHAALARHQQLPFAFPQREPKLLVDHLNPAFVERRCAQLDAYVRGLVTVFRLRTPLQLSQLLGAAAGATAGFVAV